MTKKMIYTSGGITGISEEEAMRWRNILEKRILIQSDCFDVFNPVEHYTFDDLENGIATDREIMLYELMRLRQSDIVVYNCHYPKSIGSAMELAIAYDNRIPILLLNENHNELHPWIEEMKLKEFDDMDLLVDYIVDHYLY